jgi:hypothetical protein
MERWQQVEEIFQEAFPPAPSGQSQYWQILNAGASNAFRLAWSRNGHELYYTSGDQIMAASYTAEGDTFMPLEKPRPWISKLGGAIWWDLAPDGKRVAVVTPMASPETTRKDHTVVFLLNFLDYLKQQVPLNK